MQFIHSRIKSLLCVPLLLFSQVNFANELPPLYQWEIDEEDFVIVNIRVNGRSVVSDMEGYYTQDNKLLLPINALQSTMGLHFKIENNILSTSINSESPLYTSKLLPADENSKPALWATDEYDHYIDVSILNLLLKTESKFSYALLQLTFNTPNINMKRQLGSVKDTLPLQAPTYDEYIDDQYHALTFPITEYSLSTSYRSKDKSKQSSLRSNNYFDLLYHQAEIRLNQNENTNNIFFKVSKDFDLTDKDIALARLHYQVGDINSQQDQMVLPSAQGRGFYLSNADPHSSRNFSTITIEEAALSGWTADLYRNGEFITTTNSNDDNLVRFEEVETFYGTNIFEIKLFGPQGEQITKTQKYTIGNSLVSPGKISYQVQFLETDQRVFDENIIANQHFTKSLTSSLSYGLTNAITFDMQATHLTSDYGENYISSGLNIISNASSYRFLTAKQLEAGYAFYAGYRGILSSDYFNDIKTNVEYNFIDDFNSPLFIPSNNIIKDKFLLSLNSKSDIFTPINWSIKWFNIDRKNKQRENSLSAGFNKSYIDGTSSARWLYNDQNHELTNQLYNAYDLGAWKLSNTVDWKPSNGDLTSINSTLRWPQTQHSFNQTQLTYHPNASATTQIRHQYTYRHDLANLQITGQYDNLNNWVVTLGLSGSLSFDYTKNSFSLNRPRSLNAGQIEAFSYLDWNENNIYDESDEPVDGTKFTGNYRWRDLETNQTGKVLLPSSSGGQILAVDLQSLSNPYLQPNLNKVKVLSHRGGVTKVNVPLIIYNEVEGTIYRSNGKKTKAIAGINITLQHLKTGKEYTTKTEYDGYYYFNYISHGEYKIKVDTSELSTEPLVVINVPDKIMTSKLGDTIVLKDIIIQPVNAVKESKEDNHYFVHLGVFKYFKNALNLADKIDLKKYPLHLYKHQKRDNHYLVAGPYENRESAQKAINALYLIPDTFGSAMVDVRRYNTQEWQLIGQWGNKDKQNSDYYFCQYAAYSSNKSIQDLVPEVATELLMLKRNTKGKTFYLLLSKPQRYNSLQYCDPQISKVINEPATAIKRPWSSIIFNNHD